MPVKPSPKVLKRIPAKEKLCFVHCLNPDCMRRIPRDTTPCPYCGDKQKPIVEFRTVCREHLTEHAHLLHEAAGQMSIDECRRMCKSISPDYPYRVRYKKSPKDMRRLLTSWRALGGTAVRCAISETSRRDAVVLKSFDRLKRWSFVHLLIKYHELCNRPFKCSPVLTMEEAQSLLSKVYADDKTAVFHFYDRLELIDQFIAEWRALNGTAVRQQYPSRF